MMVPETHLLYKEFNGVKRLALFPDRYVSYLSNEMV